jgi:hypothetical protein
VSAYSRPGKIVPKYNNKKPEGYTYSKEGQEASPSMLVIIVDIGNLNISLSCG